MPPGVFWLVITFFIIALLISGYTDGTVTVLQALGGVALIAGIWTLVIHSDNKHARKELERSRIRNASDQALNEGRTSFELDGQRYRIILGLNRFYELQNKGEI